LITTGLASASGARCTWAMEAACGQGLGVRMGKNLLRGGTQIGLHLATQGLAGAPVVEAMADRDEGDHL